MKSLRELYAEHEGKVSDKWPLYLQTYDEMLAPWRTLPVRLLEIGIQNGGSLEIWPKYFENGTHFVGCDIDPACGQLQYAKAGVSVVVGDANTNEVEARINALCPGFDIVIDDGSHTSADIVRSFARYFPKVANGGVFIAEDLHCSYWTGFGGGIHNPFSSLNFFKHLVDVLNHEHWGVPSLRRDLIAGVERRYEVTIAEELLAEINSITFANSLCFIRRKSPSENVLGARVVAGSNESVVAGLLGRRGQTLTAPSETKNVFSAPIEPPIETIAQVRQELDAQLTANKKLNVAMDELNGAHTQLEAGNLLLKQQCLAHEQEIKALLGSRSWRWTAPFRATTQSFVALASFGSSSVRSVLRARRNGVSMGEIFHKTWMALSQGPYTLVRKIQHFGIENPLEGLASQPQWAAYREWAARVEAGPVGANGASRGTVSIVVPVCNAPAEFLRELFASIQAQSYSDWELCIHDDASDADWVRPLLEEMVRSSSRVHVSYGSERGGIARSTNAAIGLARGRWLALVDHDDLLHPHALAECVERLAAGNAQIVYTDHDVLNESGERCAPYFKPDWSLDLFLAQMYVGHLVVLERSLVQEVGGLLPSMDGAQDYDLILRCVSHGATIAHVPKVLYHWRQHSGSTASSPDAKPYAHEAGRRAIQAYLDRTYPGSTVNSGIHTFCYDVRYTSAKSNTALASIIIPTRDRVDLLDVCVQTILKNTHGMRYEVIVVDNGSVEPATHEWFGRETAAGYIRVLTAGVPFNWSVLNNLAAREAKGEVLVFLNNDTEVVDGDWLNRLCEVAMRPDVGCCGPLLTYADGSIQHAGVVVGMGGWADHVYKGASAAHQQQYFASPMLRRNVLALTGACLAIEATKFRDIGGFDESFIVCGSDVELCLRAHAAGLVNVYVPEAMLIHHESKTRDPRAIPEQDFVRSAQSYEPYRSQGDPYYNPNLDRMSALPALRSLK